MAGMTTITVTLAGLDTDPVVTTTDELLTEAGATGVEIESVAWEVTPHDVRNILLDNPAEDTDALWAMDLDTDTLWDLHGEACRRIVDEEEEYPTITGRTVTLTLRYGADLRSVVTGIAYPEPVVVQMQTEDAPPAVIHSAPFSYDPFHSYYTEVHRGGPEP